MDCYVNGATPIYDPTLAVNALCLILALYRSSETGNAVHLDEID